MKVDFFILPVFLFFGLTGKAQCYMDASLPAKQRTELLLREMTLDEKIGQMCMYIGEASRNESGNADEKVSYVLGIGERAELIKQGKAGLFTKVPSFTEVNYLQELAEQSRLKIPLLIVTDAIHGHGMYEGATTVYPSEIGIASTFDPNIAMKIAQHTAQEMRATGYHWAYSPNVEIVRDARWGRTGETFGEDPYLVTEMGKAMVNGYQGNDFSDPDNVLACAKHFVGGGISVNGLNGGPADISERTLYEIFFPPFEELIKTDVYSVMAAHNEINGIPCHAHKEYLTGLLRNTWGFDGIILSDWMDIERLSSVHKVAENDKDAAKIAVKAGIDVHIQGPGFFDNVKELVKEGEISVERIDDAVRKLLYAKFQLGLFENRYVDAATVNKELLKNEHKQLALKAARKSIVLLKNNNKILPLSKSVQSVFVTGPGANNQSILGDWARVQPDENVITVLEGINKVVPAGTEIDYLAISSYDTININRLAEAKKRAGLSDVAIVVVGENSLRFDPQRTSGENMDRATLGLVGDQLKLVEAVKSSGTPVVVVLVNGGPLASEKLVEQSDVIIESWEPGMFGGLAVADVIFGEYNPGGRLPITIPRSVGHVQSFYNYKPSAFHRGNFYGEEESPLFEFGFGLSYTQFEYQKLDIPKSLKRNEDLNFSVEIENTGTLGGDEVILVYLNDKISSVTTPVKKLVAFQRITLSAGENRRLNFTIPNKKFKLYNKNMNFVAEPGEFEIIVGNEQLHANIFME